MKGKLNGWQKSRLSRLLDMMYSPDEIAQELEINRRQFYFVYIPLGCPHERDDRRYLWINGKQFREWYLVIYTKQKMKTNEAYCLGCKSPVEIKNAKTKTKEKLTYLLCNCPNCGRGLSKILSNRGKK